MRGLPLSCRYHGHKHTPIVKWILKENPAQEVNVSEKTGICTQTILEQTWSKLAEN